MEFMDVRADMIEPRIKASVIFKGSGEDNLFVSRDPHSMHDAIGRIVTIHGIDIEDVSALSQGDIALLDKYCEVDPSEPGLYKLIPVCSATIVVNEHSWANVDSFREYALVVQVLSE